MIVDKLLIDSCCSSIAISYSISKMYVSQFYQNISLYNDKQIICDLWRHTKKLFYWELEYIWIHQNETSQKEIKNVYVKVLYFPSKYVNQNFLLNAVYWQCMLYKLLKIKIYFNFSTYMFVFLLKSQNFYFCLVALKLNVVEKNIINKIYLFLCHLFPFLLV